MAGAAVAADAPAPDAEIEGTLERQTRVADVTNALFRILLEGAPQKGGEDRRQAGRQPRPVRLSANDRREGVGGSGAREGPCSCEELVDDAAEGPDVGAPVHGLPTCLFRAHICGRPDDAVERRGQRRLVDGGRAGGRIQRLGQTEVEDLDRAVGAARDVGRLQVAVHDALLVRGFERAANLAGHQDCFSDRQWTLGDPVLERESVDQFEDQHRVALVLLQAVDRGDVGMTQRREELRLAPESFEAMRIGREALGQDLERHAPPEPRVLRGIYLAHAPDADEADDVIRADPSAGLEWHTTSAGRRRIIASRRPSAMAGTPRLA